MLQTESLSPLETVRLKLQESLLFSNDIIAALLASFQFKDDLNGVILFGPAGHGKSMITTLFTDLLIKYVPECREWTVWMKTITPTTQPQHILGEISIEDLMINNKITVDYEGTSCLAHEIVILEEAFDGPPATLAALKDALTRGSYTYGSKSYPVNTKILIMCTNKSPDGVLNSVPPNIHESIKAFFERAPFRHEVKWPSYQASNWEAYFKFLFAKKLEEDELSPDFFTKLSVLIADHGMKLGNTPWYHRDFISPRFAKIIGKIILQRDLTAIEALGLSLPDKLKKEIVSVYAVEFDIQKSKQMLNDMKVVIELGKKKYKQILAGKGEDGKSHPGLPRDRWAALYKIVDETRTKASNYEFADAVLPSLPKVQTELNKVYNEIKEQYEKSLKA